MIDIEALAALPTKSCLMLLANSDRLTIRVIPARHGPDSNALGSMSFLIALYLENRVSVSVPVSAIP
jgi:hypothetical protein